MEEAEGGHGEASVQLRAGYGGERGSSPESSFRGAARLGLSPAAIPQGSLGLGPLPCLLAACIVSLETRDGKEVPAHPGLSETFLTEPIDGLPLLWGW